VDETKSERITFVETFFQANLANTFRYVNSYNFSMDANAYFLLTTYIYGDIKLISLMVESAPATPPEATPVITAHAIPSIFGFL
jgi:hypothetical protein